MSGKPISCMLAAALLICAANRAYAQYYNVDNQTLPGGPIQLQGETITPIAGGVTLSGEAVDLSSTTYYNVAFLSEFVFDPITDLRYAGVGQWLGSDSTYWTQITADGYLTASGVSGLPLNWTSAKFPSDPPATVAPSDQVPYLNIGTVAPGSPVPFSVSFGENLPDFDFIGTFASTTPVPEPSTFVLLCVSIAGGLIFFVRRRHRVQIA